MKILPQRNQLLSGFVLQISILSRRIFSTKLELLGDLHERTQSWLACGES
jgi:hypothetical protein